MTDEPLKALIKYRMERVVRKVVSAAMMSISRLECLFVFSLPTVASCLGTDKVIDFGSLANQENADLVV